MMGTGVKLRQGMFCFVSSGCPESPVVPQVVTPALVCPSSRTCPAPVVMSKRGWGTAASQLHRNDPQYTRVLWSFPNMYAHV